MKAVAHKSAAKVQSATAVAFLSYYFASFIDSIRVHYSAKESQLKVLELPAGGARSDAAPGNPNFL